MSAWPCLWAVCVFTVNFGAKGKLAGVGPDVNPSYAVKIYTTLRYASFWDFSILALSKVVKISVNYPLWHHGLNWQWFIWTWAQQITRPVCVGSCFSSECRYSECICVCISDSSRWKWRKSSTRLRSETCRTSSQRCTMSWMEPNNLKQTAQTKRPWWRYSINTFNQQADVKLNKSDSKDFIILHKIYSSNNCRSFEFSIHQRILKNVSRFSQKY